MKTSETVTMTSMDLDFVILYEKLKSVFALCFSIRLKRPSYIIQRSVK